MKKLALSVLAVGLALGSATEAAAGVTISIVQNGSNVTATGSGTLDLTGLTQDAATGFVRSYIEADRAAVFSGDVPLPDLLYQYTGFTSVPASFGTSSVPHPGDATYGSSVFGVSKSVAGSGTPALTLLRTFMSGNSIQFTESWYGQTLASLGLSTGTYTYSWPVDQVVIQIGAPVGSVPEPATWAAMILGMGMIGGALRRRRAMAKPIAATA